MLPVLHLLFFLVTTVVTFVTLILGYPLRFLSTGLWEAHAAYCKGLFGKILVNWVQHASPARARVYTDSPLTPVFVSGTGSSKLLDLLLIPRAVVTMNHQIYLDWVYLWWLAYAGNLQSSPVIVLKESLKRVPVFGWGMQMFKFLFLSRKWENDERTIKRSIADLSRSNDPLWMVLFPEGTVYNEHTHAVSRAFYEKTYNEPLPFRDVLCPRAKGLQTILKGFDGSNVEDLYDFTIAYSPAPDNGHYGVESLYGLKRAFIKGLGPQVVKIHIRRIKLSTVPYRESAEVFTQWIQAFWKQKDEIYAALVDGRLEEEQFRGEGAVRLRSSWEILECYAVPALLVLLARIYFLLR